MMILSSPMTMCVCGRGLKIDLKTAKVYSGEALRNWCGWTILKMSELTTTDEVKLMREVESKIDSI